MKKFNVELGKMLKQLRIGSNYSQQEVADTLRVSRSAIANWEQGRRTIYFVDFIKLCNVYNADVNDISSSVKKYL